MSHIAELRRACLARMAADAGVAALVGVRIYDGRAPASAAFPYITFGPASDVEQDADCLRQWEVSQQIDVWSRSHGATLEANRIAAAVTGALHLADLALADPYALQALRVTATRTMDDPEPGLVHGIVTIEALVEEVSA